MQETKNRDAAIIEKNDFIKEMLGLVDVLNVTDIAHKMYKKRQGCA